MLSKSKYNAYNTYTFILRYAAYADKIFKFKTISIQLIIHYKHI